MLLAALLVLKSIFLPSW